MNFTDGYREIINENKGGIVVITPDVLQYVI